MKKTMYCTIDTETVGGISNPKGTYNYGCTFHDGDGEVAAKVNLLTMEHYDKIKNDDYAKKNFNRYAEMIADGSITAVASEEDALTVIRNLCRHYGVKYIMAFNSGFDFCKTNCKELLDEFEFIDIWLMAVQTITHLKSYSKFCHEHGFRSSNGKGSKCATNVESIYAFITNNPDFEEEHTALSDAMNEMEIFTRCRKMHKHYTKNCHQSDCQEWESKYFPKW